MPPSRTASSSRLWTDSRPRSHYPVPLVRRDRIVSCNACWRPKSKVTLRRCGNCLVALYCNEQCQREHWNTHKGQCRLTEKQRKACEKDENLCRVNNELFKWTAKHHPTLSKTVIDALDISNRLGVEDDGLVLIFLSYERQRPKIETRFRVLSAGQTTFNAILKLSANSLFEELPKQRRLMEKDHLTKGRNVGVAFCLLVCIGEGTIPTLHRIVPITFQKTIQPSENEAVEEGMIPDWLSFLINVTDNGIIF